MNVVHHCQWHWITSAPRFMLSDWLEVASARPAGSALYGRAAPARIGGIARDPQVPHGAVGPGVLFPEAPLVFSRNGYRSPERARKPPRDPAPPGRPQHHRRRPRPRRPRRPPAPRRSPRTRSVRIRRPRTLDDARARGCRARADAEPPRRTPHADAMMQKMHLPRGAIEQKMRAEGRSEADIAEFFGA